MNDDLLEVDGRTYVDLESPRFKAITHALLTAGIVLDHIHKQHPHNQVLNADPEFLRKLTEAARAWGEMAFIVPPTTGGMQ